MKSIGQISASRARINFYFWVLGVPVAGTFLLYLARLNEVSLIQTLMACLLLFLPWQAYVNWRREGREELPVFAMLAFMYWLYYAVPLFLQDHIFSTIYEPLGHVLTESTITLSLLTALIADGS